MKPLSKAEERVLHIVWEQEPAYMKDILAAYSDPKPAKTTLATNLKRIIEKGYISYDSSAGNRAYYPLVSKNAYLKEKLKSLIGSFFNNNPTQFASFFANEMEHSDEELKELKKIYDQLNKKSKS